MDVQTRNSDARAKDLLKNSIIPIEYYGRGIKNKSLQVSYKDFRKVFKTAGGSTIVELKIDGKDKANVLVHQVDRHPVTDLITHVDLVNVIMSEEIHTKIPLEFVGTSLAVKDESGTLTTQISEIEIKCLPKDLVHSIQVSIEPLVDFNAFIRVKDLAVPANITVLNNPEDVVATVVPPRVEEEVVPAEVTAVPEGEEAAKEVKEGEEAPKKEGEKE